VSTTIPGTARFTVEIGPGYLHLWQGGELADREDARRVTEEVQQMQARTGLRRLLMDNRATKAPGEAIREYMWRWAGDPERFDRVAIVVKNATLAAAIDDREGAGPIRGFTDQDRAAEWLKEGLAANS
jgi:hypothetical protein